MSVRYEIDYSEFQRLNDNLVRLGNQSEKTLNKSLDRRAEPAVVPKITNLIPVSRERRSSSVRDKVHAKNIKWHKKEKGNLEITIKSKGGAASKRNSLGYLVFPNEGRGRTNHVEHRFMERGLEAGLPELVNGIQEDLIRTIEEEL